MRRGGLWGARSAPRSGKERKLTFRAWRLNAPSFLDPHATASPPSVTSGRPSHRVSQKASGLASRLAARGYGKLERISNIVGVSLIQIPSRGALHSSVI